MKKTILSLALAFMVAGTATISAQCVKDADQTSTCTSDKKCGKKDGDKKCGKKEGKRPDRKAVWFEGIDLTPDQQSALDNLRPVKGGDCDKKDAKCDKKGPKGNPRKGRAEYVKQVKEILTPDQYVIFLENIVFSDTIAPSHEMREKADGPRHGDGHKHDKARHEMKGAKMAKDAKLTTK